METLNVMATLLKLYGFLDSLSDIISDELYRGDARDLQREVRFILSHEGFEAVYSESHGCYVLKSKE